jgi:plasmid rolling circle replication initiator protein Rep
VLEGRKLCRARLCPLCNWRRSLKLRYQLGRVLNVVFSQDDSLRTLLLTLTEPNSSWNDFGSAIGRLLSAIAKLMRYKRVQAAVKHSFPSA